MEKQKEINTNDLEQCQRIREQKKRIIQKLKEQGGRITRQRLMLLDIILENDCSCCKEIYYKAVYKGEKIGLATVYRMVNALEEIGAISRKNMYKVICGEACDLADIYMAEFDDGTIASLSAEEWYRIVRTGLKECGYMQDKELCNVRIKACDAFGFCEIGSGV